VTLLNGQAHLRPDIKAALAMLLLLSASQFQTSNGRNSSAADRFSHTMARSNVFHLLLAALLLLAISLFLTFTPALPFEPPSISLYESLVEPNESHTGTDDPLIDPFDNLNTTAHNSTLNKRDCEYNNELRKWVCDDTIPPLINLLGRMRTKPGARVTKDTVAAFYTGLNDPNIWRVSAGDDSILVKWMNANGFRYKFYWWPEALDRYCRSS
jgi:hypothetical protein